MGISSEGRMRRSKSSLSHLLNSLVPRLRKGKGARKRAFVPPGVRHEFHHSQQVPAITLFLNAGIGVHHTAAWRTAIGGHHDDWRVNAQPFEKRSGVFRFRIVGIVKPTVHDHNVNWK